ncbi:MAG: lysophospholipid acyltransferase family protein [Thermodesulfovibrionales bacterium]
MTFFRRAYKVFLLLILNIFFLLPGLLISAAFFLGEPRQTQLRTYGMMIWAKCLAAVLGLHVQTTGQRPQQRGLFIASNHSSYTDILVIGSSIPSVFVAKAEVSSWPLFGCLAQIGGTIFVKRESARSTLQAVSEVQQKLKAGVNVIVFPEGTTDNGNEVSKFGSSFFKIPAEDHLPVLPLSIYYASVDGLPTAHAPANEMAWHNTPLLPHFWNLLSKKKIEARVHFNEVIDVSSGSYTRKELADMAYQRATDGLRILQGNSTG